MTDGERKVGQRWGRFTLTGLEPGETTITFTAGSFSRTLITLTVDAPTVSAYGDEPAPLILEGTRQ